MRIIFTWNVWLYDIICKSNKLAILDIHLKNNIRPYTACSISNKLYVRLHHLITTWISFRIMRKFNYFRKYSAILFWKWWYELEGLFGTHRRPLVVILATLAVGRQLCYSVIWRPHLCCVTVPLYSPPFSARGFMPVITTVYEWSIRRLYRHVKYFWKDCGPPTFFFSLLLLCENHKFASWPVK